MGNNDGQRPPIKAEAAFDQDAGGGAARRPARAQAGGGAATQLRRAAEIRKKVETINRGRPCRRRRREAANKGKIGGGGDQLRQGSETVAKKTEANQINSNRSAIGLKCKFLLIAVNCSLGTLRKMKLTLVLRYGRPDRHGTPPNSFRVQGTVKFLYCEPFSLLHLLYTKFKSMLF
jgi:hypothetical protein